MYLDTYRVTGTSMKRRRWKNQGAPQKITTRNLSLHVQFILLKLGKAQMQHLLNQNKQTGTDFAQNSVVF